MLKMKPMVVKRRCIFAGILAMTVLSLGWTAQPSLAATKQFERVLNMVDMQRMLTQKISKNVLLVALDVDRERNLRDLRSSRDLFDRMLVGLRDGDVELGLIPTTDQRVLDRLDRVDDLWVVYDAALKEGLNTGQVAQNQVDTIAELSTPLLKAVQDTVESYKEVAAGQNLFSLIGVALDLSGRQRMLSQKMAKEFFLVAYGRDVEQNRKNLRETQDLFDATLRGLINGNPSQQLMAAPTPEIKAQLEKVERIWQQVRPALDSVARGNQADQEMIATVTRMNVALLKTMNMAVLMYENL